MTDTVDKIVIQSEVQGASQTQGDLKGIASGMDGVSIAATNLDKSTGSVDSKFAALERRFSTTSGQAAQLAKVQQTVNAAVAANPSLQDRANEVLSAATARYSTAIAAEKALTDAHVGLNAQGQAALHSMRSVIEQIALGVPPTQALTGQFNHLAFASTGEGGLSGAFKQVGGLIGSLVTPMRLAVGGTAALAAGALYLGNSWSESQAQVNRAVIGIGAATGSTAADLNAFSKANASATGLTIGEARNAAIEFTKTGDIAVKNLKGVGDAVHGYAVLTGKDATDATKDLASALSGDLVTGAEALNKTYMAFDASSLQYIQTLQTSGDRTKAVQFIIDSIAQTNLKAADSVGILTKGYQALAGAISLIKNGPAPIVTGSTPQDTLQQAQSLKRSAGSSFSGQLSGGFGSDILSGADSVPIVNQLDEAIKTARKDAQDFGGISAEAFVKLSTEAKGATDAIFPQIEQIRRLEVELSKLEEAKSKGAAGPNVDAAIGAYRNQIAGLEQSVATADLYNTRVKEIGQSWGDVGQSTALALQAAQNQLPVYEAVGGAAKLAAQSAADYANYVDQGKTAAEAAALAASNHAAAVAQINSSAQATLASLQDQYAVASAQTPLQAAKAQAEATYNQLVRDGVDGLTAQNVAAQQLANTEAQISTQKQAAYAQSATARQIADQQEENRLEQIYQANQKAVEASRDQLALIQAAGTSQEANVKASIAYRNAIESGATSSQAAVISNNVGAAAALQWAQNAQKIAEAYENAARAAHDAQFTDVTPGGDNSFSFFGLKTDAGPKTSTSELGSYVLKSYSIAQSTQDIVGNAVAGGVDSALASLKTRMATTGPTPGGGIPFGSTWEQFGLASKGTQSDLTNAVSQIYDLKIAQAGNDNAAKASVYNDEISYYQSQPQTLDTLRKIADLKNSLDALKSSTDSLTAAEQASLNPLYNGRDALKIGYYRAASGLDVIAQGPTSGDQVPFHAMVNGGEQITIRTPAQQAAASSTSNDNRRSVVNNNTFVFNGSQSTSRRSQRQFAQGFGQSVAALS